MKTRRFANLCSFSFCSFIIEKEGKSWDDILTRIISPTTSSPTCTCTVFELLITEKVCSPSILSWKKRDRIGTTQRHRVPRWLLIPPPPGDFYFYRYLVRFKARAVGGCVGKDWGWNVPRPGTDSALVHLPRMIKIQGAQDFRIRYSTREVWGGASLYSRRGGIQEIGHGGEKMEVKTIPPSPICFKL